MTSTFVRFNDTNAFTYTPSFDACAIVYNSVEDDRNVLGCPAPASATFKFTGTTFYYYLTPDKDIQYSPMMFSIDNGPAEMIAPPNLTTVHSATLQAAYSSGGLENTEHVLHITPAFEGGSIYAEMVEYLVEGASTSTGASTVTTTSTSTILVPPTTSVSESSSPPVTTTSSSPIVLSSSKALLPSTPSADKPSSLEPNLPSESNISAPSIHNGAIVGLAVACSVLASVLLGVLLFYIRRRRAQIRVRELSDSEARAVIDPLPPPAPTGILESSYGCTPFIVTSTESMTQLSQGPSYSGSPTHSLSTSATSSTLIGTQSINFNLYPSYPYSHSHTSSVVSGDTASSTAMISSSKTGGYGASEKFKSSSSEALLPSGSGITPPPRYTLASYNPGDFRFPQS